MDALFDVPADDRHPDAAVARQEIRRYYADQVTAAQAALAEASQRLAAADRALAAWDNRGQITPADGRTTPLPGECCPCYLILAEAQSRWMAAAHKVIDNPHDEQLRAAAQAAEDRERALIRWLSDTGHDCSPFTHNDSTRPRRRS